MEIILSVSLIPIYLRYFPLPVAPLTWITQTTTAMRDCLKVIFIYADLDHQGPLYDHLSYADLDNQGPYCDHQVSLFDNLSYADFDHPDHALLLCQNVY